MNDAFEHLVDSYISTQVGLVDHFLSESLASELRKNLLELYQDGSMYPAGVGNKAKFHKDPDNRRDKIFWLDRSHGNPVEDAFFDVMDAFVKYLNETCYAGITGYEFHYALYNPGAFYKRHIDQFKDDSGRAFSMINYLNEGWNAGNGGELCIYFPEGEQKIVPEYRRCVFFKSSELEHEVLVSHAPRMSITGWFKRSGGKVKY